MRCSLVQSIDSRGITFLLSVFSSAGSSCTPDNSPDDSLATRSLRNDLLVAADSVTNAMSSLVRELNSGQYFTAFMLLVSK